MTTPLTKTEALAQLESAWTEFYAAEVTRIDDDVAFLKEVRQGISGSADLRLATIRSATVFTIDEVNQLLIE
jgi:hypothetical protein